MTRRARSVSLITEQTESCHDDSDLIFTGRKYWRLTGSLRATGKTRTPGWKLKLGTFKLEMGQEVFPERATGHWSKLPREGRGPHLGVASSRLEASGRSFSHHKPWVPYGREGEVKQLG